MYDRFAGSRERALKLLERSVETPGNSSSAEIVTVAEQDETVAGALAAFPVGEAALRSRAFLSLTVRSIPPWRWFGAAWLFWAGAHATPSPPQATLYVDALAVDERSRRRGVARALLAEAERRARERGLPAVSLDTALDNKAARSLYPSEGFDEVAYRPPGRGCPASWRWSSRWRARRSAEPRSRPGAPARRSPPDPLTAQGRTAGRASARRRPRRPGTRPRGGRSARGRSSSGGSPAGRAWSGRRARAARSRSSSRSTPRGSWTT